jgi:1,4-dihydroxy-6-naphthoate synthase
MFYAMVHHKIDTFGHTFSVHTGDISELNTTALSGSADMIKVSSHALGLLHNGYYLINSGSAMGHGCGPLLIAGKGKELAWSSGRVGVPGMHTTAHALLSMYHTAPLNKEAHLFSDMLDQVESGALTGGLLIHEQRFTWQSRNVSCIVDLGLWWEEQTGLPIPLGSILVSKKLGSAVAEQLQEVMRASVQWAFDHPEETLPYMRQFAQEMETSVMMSHVHLYVNKYSLDIGAQGLKALDELMRTGVHNGQYDEVPRSETLLPG